MRMWMVEPGLLSNQRLLGEHNEIHKHKHNFEKGHSMEGRVFPVVLVEPESMQARHDALALEIAKRWPKKNIPHRSPYVMPDLSKYPDKIRKARVDVALSIATLKERCEDCKARLIEAGL